MGSFDKVLIIGLVWPEPDTTAAGSRMMQLIRLFLANEFEIHFASAASQTDFSVSLEDWNVTCHPIQLNDRYFNEWILKLGPDFVVFDRFVTEEQFSWRVRESCSSAVRILNTEDLHLLREARKLALRENKEDVTSLLLNEITLRELASIYRSDVSLVISEYEHELLTGFFNLDENLLHYLPFLLEGAEIDQLENFPSFSERRDFMTMGNWRHGPNRDSVFFLREEVWPRLREQMPDARIHVYGAYGGERDLLLHDPSQGFYIEGWIDSKIHAFTGHRVCLAPLRFGAGLKGKLIDSMRYGLPSVTTSTGAEGISGDMPWNGYVFENPDQLAKAAVHLYQNKDEWEDCQLKGIRILKERFRQELFDKKFFKRMDALSSELEKQRSKNFVGALLWHHSAQSTKYLSKWIEAKNRNRKEEPRSPK
jgi:hypothetical protein